MSELAISETTKLGRPAIEIKNSDIEQIEIFAGRGMTLHQIAVFLDISDSTLDRWLKHPQIKRSYERGRLLAQEQIAGTLFKMAIEGDVVACIFYLKAQFGWQDKPQQEVPQGSQVVFYIPDNGRGVA
jgi:hypothetical protein